MKISHVTSMFSLLAIVLLSVAFTPIALKDNIENNKFKAFLSHFDSKDLPYSITLSDTEDFIKKAQFSRQADLTEEALEKKQESEIAQNQRSRAISNPTFLPEAYRGSISRMSPPIFEPMAQFELNDDMIAVVYGSSRRFGYYYENYKMLIYNKEGDILNIDAPDNKLKAKYSSELNGFLVAYMGAQKSMTCKIDAQGHIWQNTYEHEWAKDAETYSIEKNTLKDFKLVETKVFKVTKKGKIEEMKEYPTTAKAEVNGKVNQMISKTE